MIGPVLKVSDIQRSRKLFVEGLGMIENMTVPSAEGREFMMGFTRAPTDPQIILLAGDEPEGKLRPEHGTGYERTILFVFDIAATAGRLRALGFKPSYVHDMRRRFKVAIVSGPDGYRYELIQPATK